MTIATDCPKNETTNYVYEKSINTTSKYNSTDLEVDKNGNMYIMESNAKRVSILNNDGSTKSSFTINLDISLIVDAKFAVDDDGNIFVSTVQKTGSYTSMPYLVKFDQNGNELARWEPGSLGNNSGVVAHDRISEINVDTKNNVFFRFERYGNPAWSDFTESYIVKYNNSLSEEIKKWKLQNSYTGSSFAIDPFNNVYGFERGKWNHSLTGWNLLKENCVHKFSSEGIDLARWCKANPEYNGADKLVNSDNDAFISFDHMMVDKDSNYLMLSSWSSSYAVMYGSGHNYIGRIGEGFGGFSSIKLAEDGKLYAPSLIRPEILVFSPTTKPIEYKTLNN